MPIVFAGAGLAGWGLCFYTALNVSEPASASWIFGPCWVSLVPVLLLLLLSTIAAGMYGPRSRRTIQTAGPLCIEDTRIYAGQG